MLIQAIRHFVTLQMILTFVGFIVALFPDLQITPNLQDAFHVRRVFILLPVSHYIIFLA